MPDAQGSRLYPRGFIGGLPKPRLERVSKPSWIDQLMSHQFTVNRYRPADSTTVANPDVEVLYAAYIKQSGDVTSFDFRTRVLSVALKAFGTNDFRFWLAQQRTSPAVGERHQRFLRDMLRFIGGERRELPLDVWSSLLVADNDGIPQGPDRFVEEWFATNFPSGAATTTNILQMWCSRYNGIEDLLVSLHLLFGDF